MLILFVLPELGIQCTGTGSGGKKPIVEVSSLDPRCAPLGEAFPGLDFLPDDSGTAVAALSSTVIFLDVNQEPPALLIEKDKTPKLPLDSDGDGTDDANQRLCASDSFSTTPVFGAPYAVSENLVFVSAGQFEEVLFFEPPNGELTSLWVGNPNDAPNGSYFAEDYPYLPQAGMEEMRTAISTKTCIYLQSGPGGEPFDSAGFPIGQAPCCVRDPNAASYTTRTTAGMARASDHLFVATSNLLRAFTAQFLPGTVLVFEFDLNAQPPTIAPDAAVPVLFTTGFNPTGITAYRNDAGRELILVTVTGAIGGDGGAGAANVKTEGFIDIIDAASRRIVATIPLGLSGAAFDPLAIDAARRVAFFGATSQRHLYAIDLAPLSDESLYAKNAVIWLDGSDPVFPDARIFTVDSPFEIPARADSPPPPSCVGFTSVGTGATGTSALVADFCDGTLTVIDIESPTGSCSGSEADGVCCNRIPLPGACFSLQRQENILAPITQSRELNAPSAVQARPGEPGVDYGGPDVYFIGGDPGELCGIRVDSFTP